MRRLLVELTVADDDTDERVLAEIDGHVVMGARIVPEERTVLVLGGWDGFRLVGPYADSDEAQDDAEEQQGEDEPWWIAEVEAPRDQEAEARARVAAARPLVQR